MDGQLLSMLFKIIIFLPFIICLIYLVLRYGGTSLQKMQNGRFIKIIERVPVSKDNSLVVVKMGSKSYIMTSTNHSLEILRELELDEEIKLSETKTMPNYKSLKDMYYNLKRKGR